MKQHKWAKEIKAWADGAEIEYRAKLFNNIWGGWVDDDKPDWNNENYEFRIKSQPKEPQYLYVYKPDHRSIVISQHKQNFDDEYSNLAPHGNLLGKIKLEQDK